MAKESFSVKAILRTDKEKMDGTCPINYQVRINSKIVKLRSGDFCEVQNWNSQKGCFKGSASSQENGAIDNDLATLKDFLREQKSLKRPLDVEMVKEFWSTNDSDDFYEFYDKFCVRKFTELAEGTQYHYILLRKRLKSFKKEIKLSQLTLKFIEDFHLYLSSKLETGDSGVWSRHKNLKAVLAYAFKNSLIRKNPYDDFEKHFQPEPEPESLEVEEIKRMEKIVFSSFKRSKGLELSRDLFLFSNYTGLRFSDVISLTKDKIVNDEILSLKMQKTKKLVQVPLSIKAKQLIKKYQTPENERIFPDRTNVSVNRDLKQVASLCKIKKTVHFHLARHTFATTLVSNNTNAFIVMRLLGHKDIRMTTRYVNNNMIDLTKAVAGIDSFN